MSDDRELARACAAGDPGAIAAVEARCAGVVTRALARLRMDAAEGDEIRQVVREKLFVGTNGKPPGIAAYEGKGPLEGFVRAFVVHAALGKKRADKRVDHEGDSAIAEMAADDDPTLAAIRRTYGASFKQAFHDALASLDARERNVLRLVYVEGLAVEQVGLAYGVHRVSVSRWLSAAREQLHSETRRLLVTRLSLGPSEAASVARLCLSAIDLSLDRLLRDSGDG